MDDKFEKLSKTVVELLNALEDVSGGSVADRSVSLEDADLYNYDPGSWLNRQEIVDNRRALVNAVSAEKWMEGAKAAMSLLRMMGVA